MSAQSDLAAVIALACETEDRTLEEDRALLRLAIHHDNDCNKLTTTNRREGPASRLVAEVLATSQHPLTASLAEQVDKTIERAGEWDGLLELARL